MRADRKTAGAGDAGGSEGMRSVSKKCPSLAATDVPCKQPQPVWRRQRVRDAADWINEHRDELIDLPWPIWRMVRDRFDLTLAETLQALHIASAARNGGL